GRICGRALGQKTASCRGAKRWPKTQTLVAPVSLRLQRCSSPLPTRTERSGFILKGSASKNARTFNTGRAVVGSKWPRAVRPGSSFSATPTEIASSSSSRPDRLESLDGSCELVDGFLRVAEEHDGLGIFVERSVDAGETGVHAALEDDDVLRLVDVEYRHAVDRARGDVAGRRVRDVVGADDQGDVGAGELRVDVLHV